MIGVGGYASGPAMMAGGMMNVPMMAFEPNVIPGIANRLVAPMVQRGRGALRGDAAAIFATAIVTGVPVRQRVLPRPAASAGRAVQRCWSLAAARERTPSTSR